MGATLDGIVAGSGAVFEAKFMLPWSFSEEAAAEKHMPQLQHNMWVTNSKAAALSIITGGGPPQSKLRLVCLKIRHPRVSTRACLRLLSRQQGASPVCRPTSLSRVRAKTL
jgi:hypothetical protein